MMKWIVISEEYLSYLRAEEERIPKSDYGKYKFKPFFGVLFETDEFYYVTQVSSAKERHKKMKQNLDFFKLYDEKTNKLLAVVNLNYMFPVPKVEAVDLDYRRIEEYREFETERQKSQYVHFLKIELKLINKLDIGTAAKKLYTLKNTYPDNIVAKRCIDFKSMEKLAGMFISKRNV